MKRIIKYQHGETQISVILCALGFGVISWLVFFTEGCIVDHKEYRRNEIYNGSNLKKKRKPDFTRKQKKPGGFTVKY